MKRLLVVLGLLLLASACSVSTTVTTPTDNSAEAYIHSAGTRFAKAFSAGDLDTVVTFYTDDAVILPPNADLGRGAAGIRKAFSTFLPMKPQLALHSDRVVQSCDLAYEYGTYDMTFTPPGQSAMSDRGKFVTVWRRMPNGDWKIAADIFNTSMPAPGM